MLGHSELNTIEQWNELAEYLFELANTIPEHREMLFRLSDAAKAQAEKLRQESASRGCS